MRRYHDRRDAGRALAAPLAHLRGQPNTLVLALPRGGVPVAAEVASALGCPLDVCLVRKLGVPGQEEFAMGAIAEGGIVVTHDEVIDALALPRSSVDRVAARERVELARREAHYRRFRTRQTVSGRVVVIVDDGLATGATMEAAVSALRARGASRVVVAVPTGSREACARLARVADEVVCPLVPEPFTAVGAWYDDFSQTTDEEVDAILRAAETPSPQPG